MKRAVYFLLSFALIASALCSALAAAAGPPYEINAILSLTGVTSDSANQEAEALRAAEGYVNKSGGINGRPIKVVVADDASSPQVAVQLLNGLIAKKVPVVLGSSSTGTCSAMMPIVQAGGPVLYCFAPGLNPPAGGYAFTSSVNARDLVTMVLNYFSRTALEPHCIADNDRCHRARTRSTVQRRDESAREQGSRRRRARALRCD